MSESAVFISHAEEDREIAMRLCEALEAAKIRCWIAPRDIPAGESYLDGISHGLDLAGSVVVLLSEHANASKWVLREVERATTRNITVIPARLHQTTPSEAIGLLLSTLQWVDLGDGSSPQALAQVVAAVEGRSAETSSLDDLKATDSALTLAAITSIGGGLFVGAWGIYVLLTAEFAKHTCNYFGYLTRCSVGGGLAVVAAFCTLMCGVSIWTRSRSAVPLAWLCVAVIVPSAIDGIVHRYSAFAAPALVFGVIVPIAIVYVATRHRKRFR